MNMRQHIREQAQIHHINTEMQLMKQVVGIQMAITLCIRSILSSTVEDSLATMILAQVCSTMTTAIGITNIYLSFRLALVV